MTLQTLYIVSWTDMVHQVDGAGKTRHFPDKDSAVKFASKLKTERGVEIRDLKVTKQTAEIDRKVVWSG